jgi:hypothetical protein
MLWITDFHDAIGLPSRVFLLTNFSEESLQLSLMDARRWLPCTAQA